MEETSIAIGMMFVASVLFIRTVFFPRRWVKNPHMMITALDPPREYPPRRWKCGYCGDSGLHDALMKRECPHVYPPCETCGETPECARDCGSEACTRRVAGEVSDEDDRH